MKVSKLPQKVFHFLVRMGWDARQTLLSIFGLPHVVADYQKLKNQNSRAGTPWRIVLNPCFPDRFMPSGQILHHYFHQDLFVSQQIFKNCPEKHVDFGSSISGFISHVASFREIEVFDVRPLPINAKNIFFKQCDLMNLSPELHGYTDSLSCLHVLEHLGLGRYGDIVDLDGHLKGFENLYHVLKPRGRLFLSVPIGPERIEFNAHRVFSLKTVLGWAKNKFKLDRFSYIDDENRFFSDIQLSDARIESDPGVNFGCGIFEMIKY